MFFFPLSTLEFDLEAILKRFSDIFIHFLFVLGSKNVEKTISNDALSQRRANPATLKKHWKNTVKNNVF